jgi:hypothetical protein
MTSTMFAPKEVIPAGVQTVEVLSVEEVDLYGPQLSIRLKVVGGDYDGHTFTDYANRDEDTGKIKQGSKAWDVFLACLGQGFHERVDSLDAIVGKRFMAKVDQTKTGSRNKLEHGTIGPVTVNEEEAFNDIPF